MPVSHDQRTADELFTRHVAVTRKIADLEAERARIERALRFLGDPHAVPDPAASHAPHDSVDQSGNVDHSVRVDRDGSDRGPPAEAAHYGPGHRRRPGPFRG